MSYVVVITQQWYGPDETKTLLGSEYSIEPMVFPTRSSAEAEINRIDRGVYRLQHNESGRPSYEAVAVSDLPRVLRDQVRD